jgi:hypothetical protein
MKKISFAFLLALAVPGLALAQDADRKVTGGGISVDGWKGQIDAAAVKKGLTINDSKFAKSGDDLHLTIGPAAFYWKDDNTASNTYTVSATFKEPKPSGGHPHPYGIFIGGKDLATETPTALYCVPYSDGTVLVRGFAAGKVVTIARRGPNEAVNKPAADGSVTQHVAWSVKPGEATCLVNGKPVGTFDGATLAGHGITSLNGVYGLRVSHNVDLVVSGFAKK